MKARASYAAGAVVRPPFSMRTKTLCQAPTKGPEKFWVPAPAALPSHALRHRSHSTRGRRRRAILESHGPQARPPRGPGPPSAAPLRTLVSLPRPEIPRTIAPSRGRRDSTRASATAISSRLGPSRSADLTLKMSPKEKRMADHRRTFPQETGGSQRKRRAASRNQQTTFWNAYAAMARVGSPAPSSHAVQPEQDSCGRGRGASRSPRCPARGLPAWDASPSARTTGRRSPRSRAPRSGRPTSAPAGSARAGATRTRLGSCTPFPGRGSARLPSRTGRRRSRMQAIAAPWKKRGRQAWVRAPGKASSICRRPAWAPGPRSGSSSRTWPGTRIRAR